MPQPGRIDHGSLEELLSHYAGAECKAHTQRNPGRYIDCVRQSIDVGT
jgi:hypothetical protein